MKMSLKMYVNLYSRNALYTLRHTLFYYTYDIEKLFEQAH